MFQRSLRNTAWLALILTACCSAAVAWPLAIRFDPQRGIAFAILAAAVCLFTSLVMVELFFRFHSPDTAYALAVLGQLIRMAFPLTMCAAVLIGLGPKPAQALAICFLIVYPAILAVETWLFVKELQQHCN